MIVWLIALNTLSGTWVGPGASRRYFILHPLNSFLSKLSIWLEKMLHILQQLEKNQGLVYRPKRGILRIFGPEARDFLERMCTQNLTNLSYQNPKQASFITHQGKMVEYVAIFVLEYNNFV